MVDFAVVKSKVLNGNYDLTACSSQNAEVLVSTWSKYKIGTLLKQTAVLRLLLYDL